MNVREFDLVQKANHLKCSRHPDSTISYLNISKDNTGGTCFYCRKDQMSIDLGELQSLLNDGNDSSQQSYQKAENLISWIDQMITQTLEIAKNSMERIVNYFSIQQQVFEKRAVEMRDVLEKLKNKMNYSNHPLEELLEKYAQTVFLNNQNIIDICGKMAKILEKDQFSGQWKLSNKNLVRDSNLMRKREMLQQYFIIQIQKHPLIFINLFGNNVDLRLLKVLIETYDRMEFNIQDSLSDEICRSVFQQFQKEFSPVNLSLIETKRELQKMIFFISQLQSMHIQMRLKEWREKTKIKNKSTLDLLKILKGSAKISQIDFVKKLLSNHYILYGHKNGISSVIYSPDGEFLASGSQDTTIRIWNLKTGKALKTLEGHNGGVSSIAYSRDGKYLASGSGDSTIRIWDLNTGVALKILEGHTRGVSSIIYSPDGEFLASGSHDYTIRIWKLNTGKTLKTLEEHKIDVTSVVYLPDGKSLASGSQDTTIRIWDLNTGKTLKVLEGHNSGVSMVTYSPKGKYLVSGSLDTTIRIWDLNTGKTLKILEGHNSGVSSVIYSPDGKCLASGSADKTIRIWDLATGKILNTLFGHNGRVSSVIYSQDGNCLVSGSLDRTILVTNFQENN